MFNGVFFFMYVFAGFAGFLAILLAVMLIKYWSSGNKRLLGAIRDFMICTALINVLYFWIDYQVFMHGEYGSSAFFRFADIALFIGQAYFWAAYMREKGMLQGERRRNIAGCSSIIVAASLALSAIVYIFLMDEHYHIAVGNGRIVGAIMEILICVMLTTMTLLNLRLSLPEIVQRRCRRHVIWIAAIMTLNGLWNGVDVILIMWEKGYALHFYPDFTPMILLIMNVLTVMLIFSEDFTALFKITDGEKKAADKLTARLDYIAETHYLTERERQVMELAYRKMTNPEIAEELCISKYTVKNHMHNIFEKLDISTRGDLILFVDDEK